MKQASRRDPALINQYKLLRMKLYGIDERFVGFRLFNSIGAEDYDDPDNQMILIKNGKELLRNNLSISISWANGVVPFG